MGSATVSVVNTTSPASVISTIDVSDHQPASNSPYHIAVSGGNALLHVSYVNGGFGYTGRANVDIATGQVILRDSTTQPQWFGLEYLPSSSKLYAIGENPPTVKRLNKDTLAIETSTSVGDGPHGITVAEAVPLTIMSVSPVRSCQYGGTLVTISGSGFQGEVRDDNNNIIQNGTRVFFGGNEGTSVTLIDSTSMTAVTPPHAASTAAVPVLVWNPNGATATLSGVFRYGNCITQIEQMVEE
jgi:hypothetical protein